MRMRRAGPGLAVALVVLAGGCGAAPTSSTDEPSTAERSSAVAGTGNRASRSTFAPLNRGVGFGRLRVMRLDEFPGPRDVVIYATLPNELPRVAGVVTTVGQTPLSHVNLRAIQDKIPNAYLPSALSDSSIRRLVGTYVRLTVTDSGVALTQATQAEVEGHHAAARPASAQVPARDLSMTKIRPLSAIGFDDWRAFGVKTANVATLRTLGLTDVFVPDGFGVPFSFYDRFMRENGFYAQVAKLLADEGVRADAKQLDQRLATLRSAIRAARMPTDLAKELAAVQASFPNGTSIRCRSSTNNEDLPNFNGAGLYDSRTQHPNEGHLAKCVQQVYASVWNQRAFQERDFYRIDHLATAMGVLLIPSFQDERVNGVAVSTDPVYDNPEAFYVNAQVGEDLVTNPTAKSIPEALLLYPGGTSAPISRSNLAKPGTALLSPAQLVLLRTSLEIIQASFAKRYGVASDQKFAMEIEFKITSDNRLAIKQARSWVFQ